MHPEVNEFAMNGPRPARRFVIIIALIYSLSIIIYALSFTFLYERDISYLKRSLARMEERGMLDSARLLHEIFNKNRSGGIEELSSRLRERVGRESDALGCVIFQKTGDENYFLVRNIIRFDSSFDPGIREGTRVMGSRQSKYLKKGRLAPLVEEETYGQGSKQWKSVYFPVRLESGRSLVVSCSHRMDLLHARLQAFSKRSMPGRIFLVALSVVLAVVVVLVTLLLYQNYNLLIRRLTRSMQKAAGGDLDVHLKPTDDTSMKELAESFNSLIEEMRVLQKPAPQPEPKPKPKPRPKPKPKPAPDPLADIFRRAVSELKEGNMEEARSLFTALVTLKPNSFGANFNLGVIHARSRNYDMALLYLNTARELNPEHATTAEYIEKVRKLRERKKE